MDNRQLATRANSPQLQVVSLESAVRELTTIDRKDSYVTAGKIDYNARVYRQIARDHGIQFKIIDLQKDDLGVKAHVRAWIGVEDSPEAITEAVVALLHKDDLRASLMDAVENGITVTTGFDKERGKPIRKKVMPPFRWGDDGFPMLTEQGHMLAVLRTHLRERTVSDRKAITIAKRNCVKDLLISTGKIEDDDDRPQDETDGQKSSADDTRMQELRNQIGMIFFQLANNKRELAVQMFQDTAKSVLNIDAVDLKSITSIVELQQMLGAVLTLKNEKESLSGGNQLSDEEEMQPGDD